MANSDPYSRVDYRRLIAWPSRIRREWPLIESVLAGGPTERVVDLGSGTGEHSRFLADRGFEVVGIDASKSMIDRSLETPLPDGLTFIDGSITEVDRLAGGGFGGAICLGNTLPHLTTDAALEAFVGALRRTLLPGGRLLLQLLNYEKIFRHRQRHLPLSFRPREDEEIVFLRLLTPQADGDILFYPTTLRLRPGEDPPVELVSTKEVRLRGWRRDRLEEAFGAAGFTQLRWLGAFDGSPFESLVSPDLILIAS